MTISQESPSIVYVEQTDGLPRVGRDEPGEQVRPIHDAVSDHDLVAPSFSDERPHPRAVGVVERTDVAAQVARPRFSIRMTEPFSLGVRPTSRNAV